MKTSGETRTRPLSAFVSEFVVPQRDRPKVFGGGDTPWCRIEDIDGVYLARSKSGLTVSDETIAAMRLRVFPAGAVIVSCSANLGRCAIVARPLVTNQTFIGLVPSLGVDPRFLYYYMGYMSPILNGLASGATITYLPKRKFQELPVCIPDFAEQLRIVELLDEAFEGIVTAREKAEKSLRNARALFESHLESVFAHPAGGWVKRRLDEVARDFGRGKSKHRPRNDPRLYGGRYPFVQTGDVRNSRHRIEAYCQTYNDAGLAQSKLWPAGTLCITIAANIAETGILAFDACFPDSVIGVVADETQTSGRFLEYMLQSFKVHLQALGKGSAQANINLATFANQVFPFPDLDLAFRS